MTGFRRHLVPLSLVAIAMALSCVFFLAPADSAGTEGLGEGGAEAADRGQAVLHVLLLFTPAIIAWIAALLAFRERGQRLGIRFSALAAMGFSAAALLYAFA